MTKKISLNQSVLCIKKKILELRQKAIKNIPCVPNPYKVLADELEKSLGEDSNKTNKNEQWVGE